MTGKGSLFQRLNQKLVTHASLVGYPYRVFGIFGAVTYPFYYFIWHYFNYGGYENLPLRLVVVALCLPLIFHQKWPEKWRHYLPLYWYFTLLYCLPFLFAFFTFQNHLSISWVLNSLTVVILSILLLDFIPLIVITTVGGVAGYLVAEWMSPILIQTDVSLYTIEITYLSVIVFGSIFANTKKQLNDRRLLLKSQEVSQAKSQFIANMSHDLRTPMTGVMGMLTEIGCQTEDIKKEPSKAVAIAEEMSEYVEIGKQSTTELLALFNEIIETVKLDTGHTEITEKNFSLTKAIQALLGLLKSTANDKGLDLQIKVASSVPEFVKGDQHYFDRILVNLLSNALKFTDKGQVTVTADLVSGNKNAVGEPVVIDVCVIDTGKGIPEDKLDDIFGHFSRIDPSYEGAYKGSGLGLYTVKRYVEALKGQIKVESQEGNGSCFKVSLPFVVADHSEESERTAEEQKAVQQVKNKTDLQAEKNDERLASTKSLSKPAEQEASSTVSANVMVVEDNTAAAIAIERVLKRLGCSIQRAATGNEAVTLAQGNNFDIIFMDIGLPDISGLEATKKIRAFSQVPIIAVTGHVDKAGICLEAGMQELLVKPATPSSLEAMLHRHVDNSVCKERSDLVSQATIIDWPTCLKMLENNEETAHEVLQMCAEGLTESAEIINKSYAEKDFLVLRDELHKVRGGVCYLHLPQLERALKEFHAAVKAQPQDPADMDNKHEVLKQAIDSFQAEQAKGAYDK